MARTSREPRRGYYHLASDMRGGIAWQGELLREFWMWNRQFTETPSGQRRIQTVRVSDLKEAALRYWWDGWVPLAPVDEDLLRRMEDCLRGHRGLRDAGVSFPDTPFLEPPGPVPEEYMGEEVRGFLERTGAAPSRKQGEGVQPPR